MICSEIYIKILQYNKFILINYKVTPDTVRFIYQLQLSALRFKSSEFTYLLK